jgi:RHS repeat-associated protein
VDSGSVTYAHNGQGQRVLKDDGSETLFAYDEEGQLIGEYDEYGAAIQETVWFNGMPVAVLVGSNKYYVHTDHLGTPRAITNGNTVIWRWESDPFGTTAAQEDPDGDLTNFTYNLRFPGQYFDGETGLHYNYFRTYDPSTGRYLESDPIGLAAGLNTYGYALQNPMQYTDPTGEAVPIVVVACASNPVCATAVGTGLRVAAGYALRAMAGAGVLAGVQQLENRKDNSNVIPFPSGVRNQSDLSERPDVLPPPNSLGEICPLVSTGGNMCLYQCSDGTYTLPSASDPSGYCPADEGCLGSISRLQGVRLGDVDWWRGISK